MSTSSTEVVKKTEINFSAEDLLTSDAIRSALNNERNHPNCVEVAMDAAQVIEAEFGTIPQIVIVQNAVVGGGFHVSFKIGKQLVFVSTGSAPAQIAEIHTTSQNTLGAFILKDNSAWRIRHVVTKSATNEVNEVDDIRHILQTWNVAVEIGHTLQTVTSPEHIALNQSGIHEIINTRPELSILQLQKSPNKNEKAKLLGQLEMLLTFESKVKKIKSFSPQFLEQLFTLLENTKLQILTVLADDPRNQGSDLQVHMNNVLSKMSKSRWKDDAYLVLIMNDTGRLFDPSHNDESSLSQLMTTIEYLKQLVEHEQNKIESPPDPLLVFLIYKLSMQAYNMLQNRIHIGERLNLTNKALEFKLLEIQIKVAFSALKYGIELLQQLTSIDFMTYFNMLKYAAANREVSRSDNEVTPKGGYLENSEFSKQLLDEQWDTAQVRLLNFIDFFMPLRQKEVESFLAFYFQFASIPYIQLSTFPNMLKIVTGLRSDLLFGPVITVLPPTPDSDEFLRLRPQTFLSVAEILQSADQMIKDKNGKFWSAFNQTLKAIWENINQLETNPNSELLVFSQFQFEYLIKSTTSSLEPSSILLITQLITAIIQLQTKDAATERIKQAGDFLKQKASQYKDSVSKL